MLAPSASGPSGAFATFTESHEASRWPSGWEGPPPPLRGPVSHPTSVGYLGRALAVTQSIEKCLPKPYLEVPNCLLPRGISSIEVEGVCSKPRLMGFPEGGGRLDPPKSGFENKYTSVDPKQADQHRGNKFKVNVVGRAARSDGSGAAGAVQP